MLQEDKKMGLIRSTIEEESYAKNMAQKEGKPIKKNILIVKSRKILSSEVLV